MNATTKSLTCKRLAEKKDTTGTLSRYQLAAAGRLIEIQLVAGLGSVKYYGTPTVKKSISGLGNVTSLGNP